MVALVLGGAATLHGQQAVNTNVPAENSQAKDSPQEQGQRNADNYIKYIDAASPLTDEQKKTITELFMAQAKEFAALQEKSTEKMKKVQKDLSDASTSGDQEAMTRAMEQYQAVQAPMGEVTRKLYKNLAKVLTPEQTAKVEDQQLNQLIKSLARSAELTDRQLATVRSVARGLDWQAQYAVITETLDTVMTPAQKVARNKPMIIMMVRYSFAAAQLTAEQLKKAEVACDQILKDPTLKYDEVMQLVNEKVNGWLTAEQKAAMEKNHP